MSYIVRNTTYSWIKNIKNTKNTLNGIYKLSTQIQTQRIPENTEQKINVPSRIIKKRPQKAAFMKSLFLGNFDTDILAFPEVLDKDELKYIEDNVNNITKFFDEQNIDISNIPLKNLKNNLNLNVFGLQSPKSVNGLELSETENCRILEILSKLRILAISLIIHQNFGINSILKKGSDKAIDKYLRQLSNGETIATFCLLEQESDDPFLMKTNAHLADDGEHWILNGSKSCVLNAFESDIFITVAKTHENEALAPGQDNMSVFIVEKNVEGVEISPCHMMGFESEHFCNISFNNALIPKDNLLGEGADSIKILSPLLSKLRLNTGPLCISILRDLTYKFSDHVLHTKHGEKYLCDMELIRGKLAELHVNLYAVESVTYMTSGLLDKFENQDCELENAIVKVFTSEKCLESVEKCMKLTGIKCLTKNHWLKSLHNDALTNVLLNETNDSLRVVIALLGLQFAGVGLNDSVKKLRNPFTYPGFMVRKMFEQRRQEADDPKLEYDLENYLHPSLTLSARWLEYCVSRLQYATETLLIRHGPEIVERHLELKRLADVAVDVYAMVSVLSRSSRSYCIGLQNADSELLLANSFCLDARERVQRTVLEISRGPYGTNDGNGQKIAKRALQFHGCYVEHPLTKNF